MVHRDLGLLLIAVLMSGCAVWQKNIPQKTSSIWLAVASGAWNS